MPDRKPVKVAQYWCYVVKLPGAAEFCEKSNSIKPSQTHLFMASVYFQGHYGQTVILGYGYESD